MCYLLVVFDIPLAHEILIFGLVSISALPFWDESPTLAAQAQAKPGTSLVLVLPRFLADFL
jgi:hypothetical protein